MICFWRLNAAINDYDPYHLPPAGDMWWIFPTLELGMYRDVDDYRVRFWAQRAREASIAMWLLFVAGFVASMLTS